MTLSRPVAFYAPLKSPNSPSPSGDRTMARLLMKALDRAGFPTALASDYRTLDKAGDAAAQQQTMEHSLHVASRLIAQYRDLSADQRPCLWFTYHVYYKAPDWIGPAVSNALQIPYVIAEGSRAAKRAEGRWALSHRGAEAALDRADVLFVMTAHDREALQAARRPHQTLIDLPPFLDAQEWPENAPFSRDGPEPRLLTVAMMREGDKRASYRLLAAALDQLRFQPWTLDIVGDGEALDEVSGLFAPFGHRVRFHGRVESKAHLRALYEQADLFVWPAVNEAYGMVLLEAQLFGCPVVAGAYGGVASVVEHETTGLLTAPGDLSAFANAVGTLLRDGARRKRLARGARRFVVEERGLDQAAMRLRSALSPLLAKVEA